jgi:endonuclease/exonuclease/phosphatase family metal-dependent hydrolase
LRIASYNVRNLFTEENSLLAGAGARAKTAEELKALIGTLSDVAADVVLLQEVGSRQLLAEVNDQLPGPYPFLDVPTGNSNRGINLAILSREPFELTSHRSLTLTDEAGLPMLEFDSEADAQSGNATMLKIQRDLMLAEVSLDGYGVLALFNVHLKSKTNRAWRLLAADVIRAAECRLIAELIGRYLKAYPDRPVLLGGDFNDTRRSAVLEPLFDVPLTDPLGETLAQNGRNPSTYWPKRRMRLDFLLTSIAARDQLVVGSEKIHASQRAKRASDHYPISLDLDYTHSLEN